MPATVGRPAIYDPAEAERRAAESRKRSVAARTSAFYNIGVIPPPKDPVRRSAAMGDFGEFRRLYHGSKFYLPDSDDHKRLEETLVQAIDSHGADATSAFAFPRGTGKTTLSWIGVQWAVLSGRKRFPLLIGANASKAETLLQDIFDDLTTNEPLMEDFPEVCYPLVKLEGERRHCAKQTYTGEDGEQYRTEIEYSNEKLVLAWVRGSLCAQHAFGAYGIMSKGIRGQHYLHKPSGEIMRVDLIVLDDIQNDENAISHAQCEKLGRIIEKSIMKTRGPKRPCSVFMPCTVIYQGDIADQYTDRTQKPRWQGLRVAMLPKFPTNKDAWAKYFDLRDSLFQDDLDPSEVAEKCNEYYLDHQNELEAGAEASWEDNFDDWEVSAIQHAMHIYHDDADSFFSEEQNQPRPIGGEDTGLLPPKEIAQKLSGLDRFVLPEDSQHVVAYIDVQKDYLYYGIGAFQAGFTGSIIDYRPFPRQNRVYFSKDEELLTYHDECKRAGGESMASAGWEAALLWALNVVVGELCGRTYRSKSGDELKMSRVLIDSKWVDSLETIKTFCRNCSYEAVMPAQGVPFGVSTRPYYEEKPKPGEQLGPFWKISRPKHWKINVVSIDTNRAKSFAHQRWKAAVGDKGCLTLFDATPREHQMFADHQHAEYRNIEEGKYGKMDIWKERPGAMGKNNEGLDVVAGICVAASMEGIALEGEQPVTTRQRRRITAQNVARKRRYE